MLSRARRPDVCVNIVPGGAESCCDRFERSDNGFYGNMQGGGNTPDAERIAVRAVFQGANFAGCQAAGYCKLLDGITGEIASGQNLSGKRSICFLI